MYECRPGGALNLNIYDFDECKQPTFMVVFLINTVRIMTTVFLIITIITVFLAVNIQ